MVTAEPDSKSRHWEITPDLPQAFQLRLDDPIYGLPETFDTKAPPAPKDSKSDLWHKRLAHPGRNKSRLLQKFYKRDISPQESLDCHHCIIGKSTRARLGKGSGIRAAMPLDLLHIDLADYSNKTEFRYLLVVVDDASSFTYVKPLPKKSDALKVLQEWVKYAEVQTGRKLKALRSDNGGEWCSNTAQDWQNLAGFRWEKTTVYTSGQNGKAERTIRSLRTMMLSMMRTHRLPLVFWPYAAEAAAFTKNLLPNVDEQIPYQVFYGKDPRRPLSLLRVFGCLAWANVPNRKLKVDDAAIPAILVGYDEEHKGWKLISPKHNPTVFWSNSVRFQEHLSWEDRTDTVPIDETDIVYYADPADFEDLSYEEVDEHDEQYERPLADLYKPPTDQELASEGDFLPLVPSPSLPTPPISPRLLAPPPSPSFPSDDANDGTLDDGYRSALSPLPQPIHELEGPALQQFVNSLVDEKMNDAAFKRFHAACEAHPYLHPTTVAVLLKRYPATRRTNMWPSKDERLALQDRLNQAGLLPDLDKLPGEQWDYFIRNCRYTSLTNGVLEHVGTAPFSANVFPVTLATRNTRNTCPTVKEALAGNDAVHWREAIKAEMDGLEKMGIWQVVDKPPNTHLVDSKLVLTIKMDANMIPTKFKARFCARGFSQREGIDYDEIFAPVVPQDAIRTILALAARLDWELDSIDIAQAYLNADLHHDVYLKPPEGSDVPKGKVYKLIKSLYGLKQSGREWNLELDAHLRTMGFHSLSCAPCVYLRGTGDSRIIIAVYVDDMLITAPSRLAVDEVKTSILNKWKITDNGPAKEFLKIKITRDRPARTITLDQRAYINGIIKEWVPDGGKSWSPMTESLNAAPKGYIPEADLKAKYPMLVGKLMWVSNTVRPDICFAVNTLARHMSKPTNETMQAALRVVKYLHQTKDEVLQLGGNHEGATPIVTYTDANWASDPSVDRRSTSGSVTKIFGSLVGWKSHVQKCVSLSAVEAEFVAASEASREALFFRYLLRSLGFGDNVPQIFTDNTGCEQVAHDPAQHAKLKHIDTRYHFLRHSVQEREVSIHRVPTADNLSDFLTKPVSRHLLTSTRQRLGIIDLNPATSSDGEGDS